MKLISRQQPLSLGADTFVFLNLYLSARFPYFNKLCALKSDVYSIFSNKLTVSNRESGIFSIALVIRSC